MSDRSHAENASSLPMAAMFFGTLASVMVAGLGWRRLRLPDAWTVRGCGESREVWVAEGSPRTGSRGISAGFRNDAN